MSDPMKLIDGEIDNLQRKGFTLIKQMIGDLLLSLVRPLAVLTETLHRRDFGERYFTAWSVFVGASLLFVAAILPVFLKFGPNSLQFMRWWSGSDWLTLLIGLAWLARFIQVARRERNALRQRYRDGVVWHSHSYGTSSLDDLVPLVYQGYLAVALGVVLMFMGFYGLGILMFFSGFYSAQMRAHEMRRFHHQVLDAMDAQIESKNLSQAIMERSRPQDTEGFAARLPAYVSDKFRERFVQKATPAAAKEGSLVHERAIV